LTQGNWMLVGWKPAPFSAALSKLLACQWLC
jgi:hypothetical protein